MTINTDSLAVSVVLLSRGSQALIQETLQSVLDQQTDFAFEVLFSSRMLTLNNRWLRELCSTDDRLRVIDQTDESDPAGQQELAVFVRESRGRYIASLNCGDRWTSPQRLRTLVEFMEEHPHCGICFNRVQCDRVDGNSSSVSLPETDRTGSTFDDLLQQQFIPPSAAIVRRSTVDPLPAWFDGLPAHEWPLYLYASVEGTIGYCNQTMTACRLDATHQDRPGDPKTDYLNLKLALRNLRKRSARRRRRQIDWRISELHWLISQQMDSIGRDYSAFRHRQLSFLYGGWRSPLPIQTKLSNTIRRIPWLHRVAASVFESIRAAKQHALRTEFVLMLIWQQPSWIKRLAAPVLKRDFAQLHRDWHLIEYLYGASRQWYSRWIRKYDALTDVDRTKIRKRIRLMPRRPVFSIIMPVHNTQKEYLTRAIRSVIDQLYTDWELCIADDASTEPHVRPLLQQMTESDNRIRCVFRHDRGNISAASNDALELAGGEFVTFLDHDDELSEHALYMVAEEINRHPEAQLIYSDEDRLDQSGRREKPYFKTDWNPDLLLSQNMICHLAIYRRQLVEDAGRLREGFEGSQDHDLVLRCAEKIEPNQIRHVPAILYHWRAVSGSVSGAAASAKAAVEAGKRAVQEHLARTSVQADVRIISDRGAPHYRVRYPLETPPLVSIVIPTRDRLDLLERCVNGLLNDTDYGPLEILIVDNDSSEKATLDYFSTLKQHSQVRVLRYEGEFNYSSINNFAVDQAEGDVVCLLNNDTEVIERDWLQELVSHAVRPEIGAVGAKLLFPDNTIQHAGVLIGFDGAAGHALTGLPDKTFVDFGRIDAIQGVSCVTAACLVLRKSIYEEVGGLDAESLAVSYNDVDLCLRIITAGYRIIWTPYSILYHHESASRGYGVSKKDRERARREKDTLNRRWAPRIAADPNMNPNLSIDHPDYRPGFPPRTIRPWE